MNSSNGWNCLTLVFLCLGTVAGGPGLSYAGASNSLMDLSADGTLLACSNRDSGTVTVVELPSLKKRFETAVGDLPEGVSFIGESHDIAVAVYGDDRIALIDGNTGDLLGSLEVDDEPYSVVSTSDGSSLWVTLSYPGQLLQIDPVARKVVKSATIGKSLRGLAIAPSGSLLVTEYYTGIVKSVDPDSLEVTDQWAGSADENLSRQITTHPLREKAYLPLQRSLTTVAHGAGSIFPYLVIVDTNEKEGRRRKRVQMDSFRNVYVVANPWEVAVSPDGKRLYIIFAGTNDMFACNVVDDDYLEVEYAGGLRLGANPRAIRVAPDGETFYVYQALDFKVNAYSARTLKETGEVSVTHWTGSEDVLLGKKLFYSAHPPMSAQRWISCSSCHPDGDSDGRTWQQPEGLRNTQQLFGLKQTHPIHWSADRDEVQDFEHTIRSPLMQGRGLIRGIVFDSLGEKNAGLSRELDALAAYANSHQFRMSPHAKSGLSESALRGKELFFSSQTACATCHSGSYFTDLKLHDVGTGQDDPTELIGPLFDTPTLLGIYRSAPYLHHGKAETLEAVFTEFNRQDQHGRTSHLQANQITDLVEYLKMLPYETPAD